MFIDRLMNQTNGPLVERMLQFHDARQRALAANIGNLDVPGYRVKDLSETKFLARLRERAALRASSGPGEVGVDDLESNIENPRDGILFHDKNNRSMEKLMSDMGKNGLQYVMAIEIL